MTATTTPARAGLYWRRGSRVTPGVMTLDGGELSFATDEAEIFRAEVADLRVTFTLYSTLVVTAGTSTYAFVTGAYAGALAPSFSDAQLALLAGGAEESVQQFRRGAATLVTASVVGSAAVIAGSILGRVVGIAGQAVGVTTLFRSQHQAFALARSWAEYLSAHGVAVRMRGTTFGRSQLVIAAIVIPALVVFGFAVYAVLSLLA